MSSHLTKWIVLMPMSEPGGDSRFAYESIAAITALTRSACPGFDDGDERQLVLSDDIFAEGRPAAD